MAKGKSHKSCKVCKGRGFTFQGRKYTVGAGHSVTQHHVKQTCFKCGGKGVSGW